MNKTGNSQKKLGFAIIGCGRICKTHTAVLSQLPGAKIVVVCDIIEERAKEYAKKYQCDYTVDYYEILKRNDVDVIDICTPTYLHSKMTVDAAEAGKHVVSEKPMALSLEDADKMIEACRRAGVKLFVVKQNRYNPPIVKLKEAMDEGRFGKIYYGNTTVRWYRHQSYYDEDEWFRRFGGGVLINQASHNIDMLQWLMGPVDSVYAKISTAIHNVDVEDIGVALLKFESGVLGTIEATTCAYPRNLEGSITILGEKGSVKVGGIQMNETSIWEFQDYKSEDGLYSSHSTTPPNIYGYGHIKVMENVIDTILINNSDPSVDGIEGRKSLELILAIYESAKRGVEIKVSEFLEGIYKKN
ncbi:MAG: Gfo/Idh/MocA family oxidoreductase [Nitrospinae bacterium]|nr:Gfo/Idh/MocA family oxidoreductase [Nitrospinota bacterium]